MKMCVMENYMCLIFLIGLLPYHRNMNSSIPNRVEKHTTHVPISLTVYSSYMSCLYEDVSDKKYVYVIINWTFASFSRYFRNIQLVSDYLRTGINMVLFIKRAPNKNF